MEKKLKQYQKIKIGQVWKQQVYASSLHDNEYVGDIYYLVVGKQSNSQWKLKLIHKDPKGLRHGFLKWANFWVKGAEIRQELEQVDEAQFKTQIVLYG